MFLITLATSITFHSTSAVSFTPVFPHSEPPADLGVEAAPAPPPSNPHSDASDEGELGGNCGRQKKKEEEMRSKVLPSSPFFYSFL